MTWKGAPLGSIADCRTAVNRPAAAFYVTPGDMKSLGRKYSHCFSLRNARTLNVTMGDTRVAMTRVKVERMSFFLPRFRCQTAEANRGRHSGSPEFTPSEAGGEKLPAEQFKGKTVTFETDKYAVKKGDSRIQLSWPARSMRMRVSRSWANASPSSLAVCSQ